MRRRRRHNIRRSSIVRGAKLDEIESSDDSSSKKSRSVSAPATSSLDSHKSGSPLPLPSPAVDERVRGDQPTTPTTPSICSSHPQPSTEVVAAGNSEAAPPAEKISTEPSICSSHPQPSTEVGAPKNSEAAPPANKISTETRKMPLWFYSEI